MKKGPPGFLNGSLTCLTEVVQATPGEGGLDNDGV